MRALQRICFPQIHPVTLSAEIIIHEVDSVLTQADRIISDCKEIICDTENPKIFFERYSLLIEKYTYMAKFEPYVEIYGYQPIESLRYYRDTKTKFEKKLIDRCYNKALIKADSLKTDKGKKNQFARMQEKLLECADSMDSANVQYLKKKFGKKLS